MCSSQTAYCVECGCEREYTISSSRETITVRDHTFSYIEMHAHCQTCGEEIYVPEINDENVQSREDGYRQAAGLITVAEINEILRKYNIGAGPLARLLGFGEVTISRYVEGQLPSRANSDLLLQIKVSYRKMEEYLEQGKEKLTPVAYQKCRSAIDEIARLYGSGKIELAARYILVNARDTTAKALQKLLYYAQAFHFAIFQKELFTDDCQAWTHGPVFPEIYYKYRAYLKDSADMPLDEFNSDFDELTTSEIALLDSVINTFGKYSGDTLSNFTHKERPWIETRGNLRPEDPSRNVINRDTIHTYFGKIVEQYQIMNPCDIGKYSSDLFTKIS